MLLGGFISIIIMFPREKWISAFVKKWISAPNCHVSKSVAVRDNGRVVGYPLVCRTLRRRDGWRIGHHLC